MLIVSSDDNSNRTGCHFKSSSESESEGDIDYRARKSENKSKMRGFRFDKVKPQTINNENSSSKSYYIPYSFSEDEEENDLAAGRQFHPKSILSDLSSCSIHHFPWTPIEKISPSSKLYLQSSFDHLDSKCIRLDNLALSPQNQRDVVLNPNTASITEVAKAIKVILNVTEKRLPSPVKTMCNLKKELFQQMKQHMHDISSLGTYQLVTMGEPLPQVEHQLETSVKRILGRK